MHKNHIITAIIGLSLFLTACDMGKKQENSSTPASPVAILDIDLVAEKTGHKQKINETLQKLRNDLETELKGMQAQLRTKLEDSKGKLGDKPTSEQQQELAQMLGKAQQEFQTLQKMASTSFKKQQTELVKELRNKIQPIAMDIAKSRGIKIVLLRSDALILAHDSSIDITNEVVNEVNRTAPAAPAMETAAPVTDMAPATEAMPVTDVTPTIDMPVISAPAPTTDTPAQDTAMEKPVVDKTGN